MKSMNWFGFGFNGFGQIRPAGVNKQVKCKVNAPVLISDVCRSRLNRSDWRIRACWSSRADVHQTDSGSHVCLSGFVSGSSDQVCEDVHPESQGCTDALIGERHLTLSFTDKVELWEIQQPQNQLVWKREHELSDNTAEHRVALPLVSGGYVQPKPPFFCPLKLCAVSLALGSEHALLLTSDGTLYSWGSGSHGQLGHGTLTSLEEPQAVEALWGVPVREVAAGNWHSASISSDGDLYMWGWNESGQLGLPSRGLEEEKRGKSSGNTEQPINTDEKSQTDVFISIQAFPALVDIANTSEISRISCGSRHTAAVTRTGDLYTWGWGRYGQLGHGTESSTDEPTLVDYFSTHRMTVKDVVCGLWNTFVSVVPKEQPPS